MKSQLRDVAPRIDRKLLKLKQLVAQEAEALQKWANVEARPITPMDSRAQSQEQAKKTFEHDLGVSLDRTYKIPNETWSGFRKVGYSPKKYIQKLKSYTMKQELVNPDLKDLFSNDETEFEKVQGIGETKTDYKTAEAFRGSMRKNLIHNQYKRDGREVKFYMNPGRENIFQDQNIRPDTSKSLHRAKRTKKSEVGEIDPKYRVSMQRNQKDEFSNIVFGKDNLRLPETTGRALKSRTTEYQHPMKTATTTYTNFKRLKETYIVPNKGQLSKSKLNQTAPIALQETKQQAKQETTKEKLKRVSKALEERERDIATKQKRDFYSFFDQDFVYDIDKILYPDKYGELFKPGIYIKRNILREMEHKYRFEPWSINWELREDPRKKKLLKNLNPSTSKPSNQRQLQGLLQRKKVDKTVITPKMVRNRKVIKLVLENLRIRAYIERGIINSDDHEVFPVCAYYLTGSKQLFMHVKSDRIAKFTEFIEKNKNFIYQYDDQGRSLLHIVVIEKAVRCFRQLITMKPYLSKKDNLGLSPLDYALLENSSFFIRELLSAGSYPFVKVFSQRSLKEQIFSSNAYLVGQSMLIWIQSYFATKGLLKRLEFYCAGVKELLIEIKPS